MTDTKQVAFLVAGEGIEKVESSTLGRPWSTLGTRQCC